MHWQRVWLALLAPLLLSGHVSAGIIFNRGPKPNASQRVPELIGILKSDAEESKRVSAAGELRNFDTKAHPEIVPILIDMLSNDTSSSVRAEAAQSLGKIRPIAQEAGQALEQAWENEKSWRVRWQLRTALWGYYLAGYSSLKPSKDVAPPQTDEPPLADPAVPIAPPRPKTPTAKPATVPVSPPRLQKPPTTGDGPVLTLPK